MRFEKQVKALRRILKATAKVLAAVIPLYLLWGYIILFPHDTMTISPPQYGIFPSPVFEETQQVDILLDINTADLDELDALPCVTPQLAAAIIDYREHFGSFESVGELISVDGIGEVTLERLRPYVTV